MNASITIVSKWTAMVPRTPEEPGRYSKISSRQNDENIWAVPLSSRRPGEWKQAVIVCERKN